MRIGLISTYPPTECGIATYTEALRQPLDHRRHETFVVSQVGAAGPNVFGVYDPKQPFAETVFDTSTKLTPDLIHVQHEYGLFGAMHGVQFVDLLMRYRLVDIPVVTTLHTVYESLTRPQELILAAVLEHSARVIVHEPYQKQTLINYFGQRFAPQFDVADRVSVIEHGIRECGPVPDAKERLGLADRKVVMLCGYFRPTKGFHKIVEKLPELIERDDQITLVLAGKLRGVEAREYRDKLLGMIDAAGVDPKHVCVLRGQFPQHTFDTVLSAADVMCLPYEVGAQSGMMCQCMAMEAPIVASNLSAFKNAIDRTGGGLICESDDEYVDTICRLLDDHQLRERIKANTRRYIAEEAGWTRIAEQHEQVYKDALCESQQPGRYIYVPECDASAGVFGASGELETATTSDAAKQPAGDVAGRAADDDTVDDFDELNFDDPSDPVDEEEVSSIKPLRPGRDTSYAVRQTNGQGGAIGKMQ